MFARPGSFVIRSQADDLRGLLVALATAKVQSDHAGLSLINPLRAFGLGHSSGAAPRQGARARASRRGADWYPRVR
jgi:hypothetical protein